MGRLWADDGQAEDQGVFCRWAVIDGKASFWKQGRKSNTVSFFLFFFCNMENKLTQEDVKLLNTLWDRPPSPFRMGDIVIRQPGEREISKKEIEAWEQSVLLE